jgi:hypothetical protein
MGGVWTKRLLTVMVAVALAAALAGQAAAQTGPGYGSPSWAPDWFKDCTNPKQWVQWTLPGQIMQWGFNYAPPPAMPTLSLGSGMLSVEMDNLRQPDYYKQVWFEVNWTYLQGQQLQVAGPSLYWDTGQASPLPFNPSGVGPGLGKGWYLDTANAKLLAYWEIVPQPEWEKMVLPISGVQIDRVVMLTQCNPIPEPVFFQMGALLGLSGLGMLKLRRR